MADDTDVARRFESLVAVTLQQHEKYTEAVRNAVEAGRTLILDYHSGHMPGKFCVAIRSAVDGAGRKAFEELAHIKGAGTTEEECGSLMSVLAEQVRAYYKLDYKPHIYLEGKPLGPGQHQTQEWTGGAP